jgi:hypothetical protein
MRQRQVLRMILGLLLVVSAVSLWAVVAILDRTR